MSFLEGKLTVFFDGHFWVGVFERNTDGLLEVCRVVFGAEPNEGQLHEFILHRWNTLVFSKGTYCETDAGKRINPKRLQRVIYKQIREIGVSTKSQQAIQKQFEEKKDHNRAMERAIQVENQERSYRLRRLKKKEKQRGH